MKNIPLWVHGFLVLWLILLAYYYGRRQKLENLVFYNEEGRLVGRLDFPIGIDRMFRYSYLDASKICKISINDGPVITFAKKSGP